MNPLQDRKEKKSRKAVLLAFLLCLTMLCTGCLPAVLLERLAYAANQASSSQDAPAFQRESSAQAERGEKHQIPDSVPSKEGDCLFLLRYERPDLKGLYTRLSEFSRQLSQGAGEPEIMLAQLEQLVEEYEQAYTQYVLADLRYSMDTRDSYYMQELSYLSGELGGCEERLDRVCAQFLSRPELVVLASAQWEPGRFERVEQRAAGAGSAVVSQLREEEQQLLYDYDRLMQDVSISYQNREWTEAQLYQDRTLTTEEYQEAYGLLMEQAGESAGQIFCRLVEIRRRLAEELGYDSYTDYCYEQVYFRDFSPEDAAGLHQLIKQWVVPLYCELSLSFYDEDAALLYSQQYDADECLAALMEIAPSLSPSFKEAAELLQEQRLYHLEWAPGKLNQAFTSYLDSFQLPFLFCNWQGNYSDPATLIHEFGHFHNYVACPGHSYYYPDLYDLAEIDSQALELLLMPQYEAFYGEQTKAAQREKLLDALDSLISGCLEDEFQQTIYARQEGWSPQELHTLYAQLQKEYGLDQLYVLFDGEWVTVPHTFRSPLYYISYAASQVPAFSLWQEAQHSPQEAMDRYLRISQRGPYDTFSQVLERERLPSPFEEETIRSLCAALEEYVGLSGQPPVFLEERPDQAA